MKILSPKWIPLILLSAGLTSCLDSPVTPTWTLNGTTALLDSKVSAIEIVKSSDSGVVNENLQLFFIKNIKLKNIGVGDSIKVDQKGFSGSVVMDSLKVDAFDSDPLFIKASDLDSRLATNASVPVPAFTKTISNTDVPGLSDNFSMVLLDVATLPDHPQQIRLEITNNLPFPIKINTVSLKNKSDATPFTSASPGVTIPFSETLIVELNVGGEKITDKMQLTFGVSTTASATPVTITSQSGLNFTVASDELIATELVGKVAKSTYKSSEEVDAGMKDFFPTEIIVNSGKIKYNMVNVSEMTGKAIVTIPELSKAGKVYQDELVLEPKKTTSKAVSLAGYSIKPAYPMADLPKLNLKITFEIQKSTGLVSVKNTDSISYSASIDSIKHKFARGKIKERIQESDQDTTTVDWPKELNNVTLEFDKATITAKLTSSLGIPAEVTPRILFDQPNHTKDSLTFASGVFPMMLSAATLASPFIKLTKAIELNQMNGFNTILNKKPEKIRYYVAATAAKGGFNDGFVFDTSAVKGNLELKIPVRFKSPTGYQKDSLYEVSPGTLTGMKSATLILDVKNKIPLKIGLNFAFVDAAKQTLVTYPKPVGNKTFYSLPVPPVNALGRSTGYGSDKILIKLEEADFKLLEKASYILLKYRVDTNESSGPSGGYSEILTTDDVHIVLGADIQYKVNAE